MRIGFRGDDFRIEVVCQKRPCAGASEDVLAQNVECARASQGGVLCAHARGFDGSMTFEHLEAVCGHQQGAGRLVETMVGAADALEKAAGSLGRSDIDDEIHVTPVDAKVEGRGADHGFQLARCHGLLDTPALAGIE